MNDNGYRRALMVGIAAMVALIAAFVLRSVLWPDRLGPRLPASSGDSVWLVSHGALHQFDASGRRLQKIDWAELPLSDHASALQFTAPDVFWAHDQSRVLRCTLSTRRCEPLTLPELGTRREYRWIRVSDDALELTVSDASSHRILVYRRSADTAPFTLARTVDQGLRFPNQTLAVDGRVWVANTNQHAITQWDATGANGAKDANAVPTDFPINSLMLRSGRRFPFAMQRDDRQQLWVLVAGPNMQGADLLRLDAKMRPDQVVALDDQQDPNALLWTGKELLATDMTRFRVDRISADGRVLGSFGDAAFLAELDAARAAYAWTQRLPQLLMGGIAVLVLLCTWLGWKAGEFRKLGGTRWRGAAPVPSVAVDSSRKSPWQADPSIFSAPTPAAAPGKLTRVHALPGATAKRRAVLAVLGVAATALVAAMGYWLWPMLYQRDCGPVVANCGALQWVLRGMIVAAVAILVLNYALVWRYLRGLESMEIATNGQVLAVRNASGKRYKRPAEQVTLTRQRLWIGAKAIPLRLNGSPLFDEAALRREVIARLPHLNVLDGAWDFGSVRHLWRHAGWTGRALVIAADMGIGALLALQGVRLVRAFTG